MVCDQVIASDLEVNRVHELEEVLSVVSQKVVEYVARADDPERGTIGKQTTPADLKPLFDIPSNGTGIKGLFDQFDRILDTSVVTWNQGFLDKLYASTNPVGVASDILLSVLNTNSHVFTVSPALTVIERKTAQAYAQLFGFDKPTAGGLTFPGGSYSNSTSLTTARSYLFPETKLDGNTRKFAVFASEHAHYSVEKAAIFCGLGSRSVFKVPVTQYGRMIPEELDAQIEKAKDLGYTPLYVNATAGTTVYGSFDDFNAIADIAEKHGIWFHIDGSWGGNVAFSETHRASKLSGAHRANSITVNPHKALGVPTTCSFLLLPDERIFQEANSLRAPYLFHSANDDEENFDLADGTMGCGRRADAVKLYLGWNWYGTAGYAARIDHAMRLSEYLARVVRGRSGYTLVSEYPPPFLQVCFYYSPKGVLSKSADENTRVTRELVHKLHGSGKFLVDYAPEGGANSRGEFFRVVVNAPIVTSTTIDSLVEQIEKFGAELA
ncbi:hypothetical protein D0Z00_003209 [Geotrichum galactomycetum]|uniref:Uncharacterized protein n=1 Tax=Geotrichum galactomycetum TaxID=27317 RepID=A0ACB6V234_9ASCO|nr:hypothetical protein D0Z00_003209 [Geotrichum candidum]